MRKRVRLLVFCCSFYAVYLADAQPDWGCEEFDNVDYEPWIESAKNQYTGYYHFGCSEGEWQLRFIINSGIIVAQLEEGYFGGDSVMVWETTFKTFTAGTLQKNKIKIGRDDSQFIFIKNGTEVMHALMIGDQVSSGKSDIKDGFPGKFGFASYRIIKEVELVPYSLDDLQIMRNEIFARYGHQFRKGGAMESYFNEQEWYRNIYTKTNALDLVTEIEKINIKTIQKIENMKRGN